MNRSIFAETLREAILTAMGEFRQRFLSETPYAFALVGGSAECWLGYAVATEQGLLRVASEYDAGGYRYQAHDREQFNNREKLATWLRWANPDDGWTYGEFPERFEVRSALHRLLESGELGEEGEGFEELCTEVLASLHGLPVWGEATGPPSGCPIVVGFTYGEDPRDFLRTATRANRYPLVQRLWAETWRGEEIDRRIKKPNGGTSQIRPAVCHTAHPTRASRTASICAMCRFWHSISTCAMCRSWHSRLWHSRFWHSWRHLRTAMIVAVDGVPLDCHGIRRDIELRGLAGARWQPIRRRWRS